MLSTVDVLEKRRSGHFSGILINYLSKTLTRYPQPDKKMRLINAKGVRYLIQVILLGALCKLSSSQILNDEQENTSKSRKF